MIKILYLDIPLLVKKTKIVAGYIINVEKNFEILNNNDLNSYSSEAKNPIV